MKKIRLFLFQLLALSFALSPALAGEIGKTDVRGYAEFSYVRDNGIGWSGSESTFYPRVKLDVLHAVDEDALVRVSGEWQPTVGPFSRAYGQLAAPTAQVDDTYLQFSNIAEATSLRLGSVKVPFARFDTLALNQSARPMSSPRWREWDYGARLDSRFSFFDFSVAVVNGEGTAGTDSNSDKSLAARIVFPAQTGEIYPETLETTNYPNPAVANPAGNFNWSFGVSGYNGTKYSTPIKQRNNHYGADLKLDYSVFSLMAEYVYMEGWFTDPSMNNATGSALTSFSYSSAVNSLWICNNGVCSPATFQRANSVIVELTAGVSTKTLLSAMGEIYKPDIDSDVTPQQKLKQRLALGIKHDFRKNVTGSVFYVFTYDPAFGRVGNITQSDTWKGEDVFTCGIAMAF
ncbi:MAG: hypothetical protein HY280_00845 [Nitrospinae bacterium]|nr:hypothetical protein [Nitrospinota bacterium]